MVSNSSSSSLKPNPKKANLMDPHSIKHLLDESVSEIVTGQGYTEDVRLSNIRLLVGTVIIAIALIVQFYCKKFSENKDFLIGCITLYPSKPNSCTSLGEEIIFFSVFLQCNLSIGNWILFFIFLRSLTPFWQVYRLQ
ncbi:signal peptidase complex subunit 2-like [Magnolia sinica]|uniref:signal peptidase complex subunit 2-like n=1 Tax=Magnolia sinica TaxID=86752 RepID=UPI0026581500|nr:signal peptidase complex subunit 2-like [Magnolia sinica]